MSCGRFPGMTNRSLDRSEQRLAARRTLGGEGLVRVFIVLPDAYSHAEGDPSVDVPLDAVAGRRDGCLPGSLPLALDVMRVCDRVKHCERFNNRVQERLPHLDLLPCSNVLVGALAVLPSHSCVGLRPRRLRSWLQNTVDVDVDALVEETDHLGDAPNLG